METSIKQLRSELFQLKIELNSCFGLNQNKQLIDDFYNKRLKLKKELKEKLQQQHLKNIRSNKLKNILK